MRRRTGEPPRSITESELSATQRPKLRDLKPKVLALVGGLLLLMFASDLAYQAYGSYRDVVFDSVEYVIQSNQIATALDDAVSGIEIIDQSFPTLDAFGTRLPTTFPEMVIRVARRGPGYVVFLAGVQLLTSFDIAMIRGAQALMHAAAGLLIFLIGFRWRGQRLGLLAIGIYAAYLPLGRMTALVLTEGLATFLLLTTTLLLLVGATTPSSRVRLLSLAAGGTSLTSLVLVRPLFLYLAVAALIGLAMSLIVEHRKRWIAGVAASIVLVGGAAIPYVAWQTTLNINDEVDELVLKPTGIRSISRTLNESYDIRTDGFPRVSSISGQVRSPNWWKTVSGDPTQSVQLRVEKVYRLWKSPLTVYFDPWVVGDLPIKVLHAVVVIAGLGGAIASWRSRYGFALLLPIMFTTAAYGLYYSEEQRFTLPTLPSVILLASFGLLTAWDRLERPSARAIRWILAVTAAGAVAGVRVAFPAFALGGSPRGIYLVAVAVLSVAAGAVCWWAATYLLTVRRPVRVTAVWLLAIVPLLVHLTFYGDWHTWRTELAQGVEVGRTISLPGDLPLDQVLYSTIQIDVWDFDGDLDDIEVTVNGKVLTDPLPLAETSRLSLQIVRSSAPIYGGPIEQLEVGPRSRGWLVLALPRELLESPVLEIAVARSEGAAGATYVYGDIDLGQLDYPGPVTQTAPEGIPGRLAIPGKLGLSKTRRESTFRYQTYGDARMYGGLEFVGIAASSRAVNGVSTADLSDDPFRQNGQFRVFVQIVTEDGRELVL